jgi:hypothetical protein
VPVLLRIIGLIDYTTAFVGFFALTAIRAAVNLYRNNALSFEEGDRFVLRSP